MPGFEAFVPAYLVKSGDAATPYRVGGICTTEDRDTDKEIVKAVDWSYVEDGFGKIKYEHNDVKGPAAVIGFPTKIIRKGKETRFEGDMVLFDPKMPVEQLSEQQRLAKATVTLLQHMDEHNKRHPNNLQKAGWSIEGEYLDKDKATGVVKARVINIVFTTKPRNKKTFAQLLKSLSVGYEHGVTDQTGFGATREQSLKKDLVYQTNHLGDRKMKSKEEVFKSCLDKGMDKKAAHEAAEKWDKENREHLSGAEDKAEKSITTAREAFAEGAKLAKSVTEVEINFDIEGEKKALVKSVEVDPTTKEIDITKYLETTGNVNLKVMEVLKSLDDKINGLAKSVETISNGYSAIVDSNEYQSAAVGDTSAKVNSINAGLAVLTRELAKSGQAFSTKQLIDFEVEDPEKGKEKQYSNLQKSEALMQLHVDGKVDAKTVSLFENFQKVPDTVEPILKSKLAEMYK